MKTQFKALVFDLDNTLFPSRYYSALARKNAVEAMIKFGLKGKKEKILKELYKIVKKYGSNYSFHFDKLLNKIAKKQKHKEKIIAAGIIAYHNTKKKIKPFLNVKKALLKLKKRYRIYLLSEGLKKKQWEKIIRLKLEDCFDDVFIVDKKTKKTYKTLLKKLKLNTNQVIVIGDHPLKDWKFPKDIGIRIIKFNITKYLNNKKKKNFNFLKILKMVEEEETNAARKKLQR